MDEKKNGPGEHNHHLYSTGEMERLLGVPDSTLVDWESKGFLAPTVRVGRHRRYTREDAQRILQVRTLTQRYRFRPQVLEALARGEASEDEPPSADHVELTSAQEGAEFSREWLIDLAARNAELFSKQRKLTRKLAAAEQRYRGLVEASPDVIVTVDMAGKVTYVSPAIARYGFEPADLVGHTVDRLRTIGAFSSDSPPRLPWDHQGGVRKITVTSREGARFWLEVKLIPRCENGQIIEFQAIGRDVTEQVKAKWEREQHEANLKRLIDLSTVVLAETTIDGLLSKVADAAMELTGAELAMCCHRTDRGSCATDTISRSGRAWSGPAPERLEMELDGTHLDLVCESPSIRLSQADLQQHPIRWSAPDDGHPPPLGLLELA